MSLDIRLDDSLAREIERLANGAGVSPQDFVVSALRSALLHGEFEFDKALKETLVENAELYRRLS